MFAVLISIHGSSFLWPCGLFRQSEGTGDEYDDTDFLLDIYIGLFGFLQNWEALLLYPLGFFMIQDRVEIVDEFSEVRRCGCEGVLAQMRALRNAMLVDGQGWPQLCKLCWLYIASKWRDATSTPLCRTTVFGFSYRSVQHPRQLFSVLHVC